jgi:hypothetical protein
MLIEAGSVSSRVTACFFHLLASRQSTSKPPVEKRLDKHFRRRPAPGRVPGWLDNKTAPDCSGAVQVRFC